MAQLVKLKDFLSRYERDPQYYSSEFPRLKKTVLAGHLHAMG